jgi:hypothetical protein
METVLMLQTRPGMFGKQDPNRAAPMPRQETSRGFKPQTVGP